MNRTHSSVCSLWTFPACSSLSVLPGRHKHSYLEFVLVRSRLNVLKLWKTKTELKKRKTQTAWRNEEIASYYFGGFKRTVKRYGLFTFQAWIGKIFGSAFWDGALREREKKQEAVNKCVVCVLCLHRCVKDTVGCENKVLCLWLSLYTFITHVLGKKYCFIQLYCGELHQTGGEIL